MPSSSHPGRATDRGYASERPAAEAHLLCLYEDEDYLVDVAVEFLLSGRKSTERLFVLARERHRTLLCAALERRGLDASGALESGLLAMVDTEAVIEQASVSGQLEVERLIVTLNAVLMRAMRGQGRVRAYGELAGILCERGHARECRQLEAFWSDFVQQNPVALLCGYRNGQLGGGDASALGELCAAHSVTLPREHCSSLGRIEARLQSLFLLEQRVWAMQADLEQAGRIEEGLRRVVDDLNARQAAAGELLRDFLASSQRDLAALGTAVLGTSKASDQLLSRVMQHGDAIASVMRVLRHSLVRRSPR